MNKLKTRRSELGLTLEEVGNIVGVGKSTVRKWENGLIENMKRDKIVLLAKALQVSPLFIMEADEGLNNASEDVIYIYNQLNEINQKDVYNYAERKLEEQKIHEMPMAGYTAAGSPLTYVDGHHETVLVNTVPKGADFTLTVQGDSMEPLIEDGSLIFIKSQPDVENGEIAVIEINRDEVTCKKVCKCEDGRIEFHSLNSKYDPIITDQYRIIGKVLI